MNKKLAIITVPVVVLLISCIIALCFMFPGGGEELSVKYIKSAKKYVDMGDYNKAILYYKEAIKADETHEEPYINLANLYYSLGDIDNAVAILKDGMEKSKSDNIKNALQRYLVLQGDNGETVLNNYSGVEYFKPETVLISDLSSYSYGDYHNKYTIESEKYLNGVYTVKYLNLDITFNYTDDENKRIDETKSKPLYNARPSEIIISDLETIIVGASKGMTADDINNILSTSVKETYDKKLKLNIIEFRYMNCNFKFVCDENGMVKSKDNNNKMYPDPVVAEEIPTETQTISTANIDVVFAMDVSGSMSLGMDTAKTALNSFIDALDDKDRAALVEFNDYATVLCGLTTDKNSMKNQIASLSANGLTSIYDGFSKSLNLLTDSSETYGYKMIVILSDGYDSYAGYGMSYDNLIADAVNNDVAVYTVGIGDNVDTALLEDISYRTGGEYYHAADSSHIVNIFDEIQEQQIVVPADTSSRYLDESIENNQHLNLHKKENEHYFSNLNLFDKNRYFCIMK